MEKFKKEPIEFKKERNFTQLLEAPFKFFIQEFKSLSRTIIRFAGPWIAIALLSITILSNNIYQSYSLGSKFNEGSLIYVAIFTFFYAIGFLATVTVTQSYITLYARNGKGNFTLDDVSYLIKKNIIKIFLTGLLVFIMVFAGFIFLYIPGIYLTVATSFFAIIIVYEDVNIGKSIGRSLKIIKGSWWITFALILVFGMMIGTIMYIFIIPVYVVIFSAAISGTNIGAGSVIVIVFSVLLYFIAYVFYIAMIQILFSFQYFNLVSKNEGINLYERINAINKPKEGFESEKTTTKTQEIKDKPKQTSENTNIEKIFDENNKEEENRFLEKDENNRFKPKY